MLLTRIISFLTIRPIYVLFCIGVVVAMLATYLSDFRLDASADSLVIEGDPDLEYSREVGERYGSRDFVFVLFTPDDELFTEQNLSNLQALQSELSEIPSVYSIDSILSVPLFQLSDVSLSELDVDSIVSLQDGNVDLQAAKEDLTSSDAYKNALISEDGKSTTLAVNFEINEPLRSLQNERRRLRESLEEEESEQLSEEFKALELRYASVKAESDDQRHNDIASIRAIIEKYKDDADIVMGGVPMIADDLVSFVRSDLATFGIAIVIFIVLSLSFLFRKPRYVLVPMLCCTIVALSVTGLLGFLGWSVTVISSNFISLLLIITISLNVHLIVRYRELEKEQPELSHLERLRQGVRDMFVPCAYTSLTTIVAFGSLMISNIPPIVDFGWMMVVGVMMSFLLTFTVFPAVMALFSSGPGVVKKADVFSLTPILAAFTLKRGNFILGSAVVLFGLSSLGIGQLKVENSFINYFSDETEIYRGMVKIDQLMGGTTPVDVIVDLRRANPFDNQDSGFEDEWEEDEWGDEEYFEDEWEEDEWGEEEGSDPDAYWFTSDKMADIVSIHNYLDALPETGKVLSLATLLNIAYDLNDGEALNSIELAVLYNRIPEEYKESLLKPYVSVADDQVRFSLRVRESDPNLVRSELLATIRSDLQENYDLLPEQVRLSGMLVLYNNMLQSLFESQILTLGFVLIAILGMFVLLFRSFKLALIGILPNILAASIVLGLMGWLAIPLDMMTITIAAISVGIGVDNTIHYMHRFKLGFLREKGDYTRALQYSHYTIGQAIYFTGFTIVAGFSILILSNFIPTIYFGLLTSLAMIAALLGALTLLPRLMLLFKPL